MFRIVHAVDISTFNTHSPYRFSPANIPICALMIMPGSTPVVAATFQVINQTMNAGQSELLQLYYQFTSQYLQTLLSVYFDTIFTNFTISLFHKLYYQFTSQSLQTFSLLHNFTISLLHNIYKIYYQFTSQSLQTLLSVYFSIFTNFTISLLHNIYKLYYQFTSKSLQTLLSVYFSIFTNFTVSLFHNLYKLYYQQYRGQVRSWYSLLIYSMNRLIASLLT